MSNSRRPPGRGEPLGTGGPPTATLTVAGAPVALGVVTAGGAPTATLTVVGGAVATGGVPAPAPAVGNGETGGGGGLAGHLALFSCVMAAGQESTLSSQVS